MAAIESSQPGRGTAAGRPSSSATRLTNRSLKHSRSDDAVAQKLSNSQVCFIPACFIFIHL